MLKRYSNNTISIRAPAKGATCSTYLCFGIFLISIRAPAKGATTVTVDCKCDCIDFNPRSREGSDDAREGRAGMSRNFNPRSREGSDPQMQPQFLGIQDFNPRSREGSDSSSFIFASLSSGISIRAPAKGATQLSRQDHLSSRFQSALPRRERLFLAVYLCHVLHISIRAPAKGAT